MDAWLLAPGRLELVSFLFGIFVIKILRGVILSGPKPSVRPSVGLVDHDEGSKMIENGRREGSLPEAVPRAVCDLQRPPRNIRFCRNPIPPPDSENENLDEQEKIKFCDKRVAVRVFLAL